MPLDILCFVTPLPALRVALGIETPEDGIESCEELNDEVRMDFVSAVKGNGVVVKRLKGWVIGAFNDSLMRRVAT
jgi:hypothetical protein